MMSDHEKDALRKALHSERDSANTRHADCWACEAVASDAINDLIDRLQRSEAAITHLNGVLERIEPDQEIRIALWRGYWADVMPIVTSATDLTADRDALAAKVADAGGAVADAWDEGWRVGRSDGKRQMIDYAHPRSKNPYRAARDEARR